jgi:hypothetical protein
LLKRNELEFDDIHAIFAEYGKARDQVPIETVPPRISASSSTLLALSACGPVTFPADRLPETVRALCLKEQKVDVDARLVGQTLLHLLRSVDGSDRNYPRF